MNKVIIIAEAGVNHNGDVELAKQLIDIAELAGADYVKFQTFKSENLVSATAEKAEYQKDGNEETQLEMLQNLELSKDDHNMLVDYCNSKNIKYLSSAFDLESLDFIGQLGLDFIKIPSGEINNLPYLKRVGELANKVVLSTGMADMNEIGEALHVLLDMGIKKEDITILHCNTEYPTPFQDVNLNAMVSIGKEFDVAVGYSDHTLGIEVPIAAVAMGATVIEKHFTTDKTLEGPDHQGSLEPHELSQMVQAIRNIELSRGNGIKEPSQSELPNKDRVRKSIHLVHGVGEGHILSEEDLIMKRPGDGISPMQIESVIGKKVVVPLAEGSKLSLEHLQ